MKKPAAALEPNNFPSLSEQPLTPAEQDVKAHWLRFLPTMSQELGEGLDLAVRKAQWLTEYHEEKALLENPGLSRLHAREMFRNQWTYLPPE